MSTELGLLGGAASTGPSLQRLTEHCISLFGQCLRVPGLPVGSAAWFEDKQARFRWWSFSLQAQATGRSSLDHRVRNHDDVRAVIADLLAALASALSECLVHNVYLHQLPDGGEESLSDASSSVSSEPASPGGSDESSLEDNGLSPTRFSSQAYCVETCLLHLMRLSILIRKSGDKFRHEKADDDLKRLQRALPNSYAEFRGHLETIILFSPYEHALLSWLDFAVDQEEIPISVKIVVRAWLYGRLGPIQQRLIQANIIRRHRMMFSRRRGKTRGIVASSNMAEPDIVPVRAQVHIQSPTVQQPVAVHVDTPASIPADRPPAEPVIAAPTATSIGSALNLGAVVRSAKASSTMSKFTRTGQDQDYPKRAVLENSLECPYCGIGLESEYKQNEKKWK